MRSLVPLALLSTVLSSCVDVYQVRGPDGRLWYHVDCPRDLTLCIQEAGDTCPRGYVVAHSATHATGAVRVGDGVVLTSRSEMLFRCRRSDGRR